MAFNLPKKWKSDKNSERAQAIHDDQTTFTIFASRNYSGAPQNKDFISIWTAKVQSKYGAAKENEITKADFKSAGKFLVYAKAQEKAVVFAVIYSAGRVLPVMFEFPDKASFDKHRKEYTAFLNSIEIKKAQVISAQKPI